MGVRNVVRQAADRVTTWLDDHFAADGRCRIDPDDPRYYVKAPYLLHAAGLRRKASACAHLVASRFIDDSGDLIADIPLDNRVYGMGWLCLGGIATERFDLANAVGGRLEQLQDPQSGGILLPDAQAGEAVGEVCFSGGAGMALAAAGRVAAARRMADRFVSMLEDQPEAGRYYNRFRADGSVVPRPAPPPWEKVYDRELDEQRPATFATVVNTLVWTGRAVREDEYFRAARRYVDLVYDHRLDPSGFGRATKFGWAMLNLHDDAGGEDLLAKARRLGDVLVALQSEDGLWDPRPGPDVDAPAHVRLSYSSDCAMTILALAQRP